jgi:hypothetical protein
LLPDGSIAAFGPLDGDDGTPGGARSQLRRVNLMKPADDDAVAAWRNTLFCQTLRLPFEFFSKLVLILQPARRQLPLRLVR